MKISPVQGTAIGIVGSESGTNPERVARAKAIAAGQTLEEPKTQEKPQEAIPQVAPIADKVIKMTTNRNPEVFDAAPPAEPVVESAPSDINAQAKPAPEAIQAVSPQIAALAKEKRTVQLERQALAQKEKDLSEKIAKANALEEQIKNGQALSALLERGVTYDDLTQQILGQKSAPDVNKLKEEILEGVRKELAGKDAAQEQAVFEHMSKNVSKMIYSSDQFPFVKAGKAQGKVMDLISRSWHGDKNHPDIFPGGEVLDEEEALQMIEAELKEDAKAYAKLLGTEVTTPAPVEQRPKEQVQPVPRGTGIKTLTNKDTARAGMNRRQRAIAAALGQLK